MTGFVKQWDKKEPARFSKLKDKMTPS